MFFEDHAWKNNLMAKSGKTIREKGFPKTIKIRKRINDIFWTFFFKKQNDFLRSLIKENQEKWSWRFSQKTEKHWTNKEKWPRKEKNTRRKNDQRTNDDRKKGKMSKERKHTKSCFWGEKKENRKRKLNRSLERFKNFWKVIDRENKGTSKTNEKFKRERKVKETGKHGGTKKREQVEKGWTKGEN